ncbi:MAG: hypothetical protein IKF96_08600, partial [Eggerthellaceae bacterium]|nr:hypothetical protein [Eggerthellaceae bacterium]
LQIQSKTKKTTSNLKAPGEVVELQLTGDEWHNDAQLFIDGRPLTFDVPVRGIRVRNGEVPTPILRYKHKGFYDDISRVFFREQ